MIALLGFLFIAGAFVGWCLGYAFRATEERTETAVAQILASPSNVVILPCRKDQS